MTAAAPDGPRSPDPRDGRPDELVVLGARERVRASHVRHRRRVIVLDDDPTGSQSVHGVRLTTLLAPEDCAATVPEPGSTGFVLTNSRSLPAAEARLLALTLGSGVYGLEAGLGGPIEIVSRSDSCLRGHVVDEIDALAEASAAVRGRDVDAVLFVPALLGSGRFTVDDVQWSLTDGRPVPVAETEFARDATFGYTASRLPDFLAERSSGSVEPEAVRSISLDDIRVGGPHRVAALLLAAHGRTWIVVNALSEHDLDVVALGVTWALDAGQTFLYRTGPSFVRALAGLEARDPLAPEDVVCDATASGHGLVVVGSHTGRTTAQLERLGSDGFVEVGLDVEQLLDDRYDGHLADAASAVRSGLGASDVLLVTSRVVAVGDAHRSALDVGRVVSAALVEVVARSRSARPSWVLAKGGITSHDVALGGLGITQAEVIGQFSAAGVSLLAPRQAADGVGCTPYVVFPGNVGGPDALADVVAVLRAGTRNQQREDA